MYTVIEPLHTVVYYLPQALAAFEPLKLTSLWSPYFGTRLAPLGAVSPATAGALLYHFNPAMVDREVSALWSATSPEELLRARETSADALDAVRGDDLPDSMLDEAVSMALTAASSCEWSGRPFGAANASLPVPKEAIRALWYATTVLREHRGDGHVTALAEARLDGVEALVTHVAAGGERRSSIQRRREWTDADWEAATRRLGERGLLDPGGSLTEAGRQVREAAERDTDRLADGPWQALGRSASMRLYTLLQPLSARLASTARPRLPVPPPADEIGG